MKSKKRPMRRRAKPAKAKAEAKRPAADKALKDERSGGRGLQKRLEEARKREEEARKAEEARKVAAAAAQLSSVARACTRRHANSTNKMGTDATPSALVMTPDGSVGAGERDLVVRFVRTDGATVGVERVSETDRVAWTYRCTSDAKTRRCSTNSGASGESMACIKTASRGTRRAVEDPVRPRTDTPTSSIAPRRTLRSGPRHRT